MASCQFVNIYCRFVARAASTFRIYGVRKLHRPEDGGNMPLRNVGNVTSKGSFLRRPESSPGVLFSLFHWVQTSSGPTQLRMLLFPERKSNLAWR